MVQIEALKHEVASLKQQLPSVHRLGDTDLEISPGPFATQPPATVPSNECPPETETTYARRVRELEDELAQSKQKLRLAQEKARREAAARAQLHGSQSDRLSPGVQRQHRSPQQQLEDLLEQLTASQQQATDLQAQQDLLQHEVCLLHSQAQTAQNEAASQAATARQRVNDLQQQAASLAAGDATSHVWNRCVCNNFSCPVLDAVALQVWSIASNSAGSPSVHL